MWTLLVAAALAAPTSDELLALSRVHCRAGAIVWERVPGDLQWILSHNGTRVAFGQSSVLAVDRQVTAPPTRVDREGAPWQWSEHLRLRNPAGGPITPDLPEVDATFRCTDLTDPASKWVDVEAVYAAPQPGPGVRRCRAVTPDAAWLVSARMAGVAPRDGDVLLSETLVLDGISVGSNVMIMGQAPTAQIAVRVVSSVPQPTKDPKLQRARGAGIHPPRWLRAPSGENVASGHVHLRGLPVPADAMRPVQEPPIESWRSAAQKAIPRTGGQTRPRGRATGTREDLGCSPGIWSAGIGALCSIVSTTPSSHRS